MIKTALQNSALLSLTSLLRIESQQFTGSIDSQLLSVANILDSVRTPRTLISASSLSSNRTSNSENEENIDPIINPINVLMEDVYFNKSSNRNRKNMIKYDDNNDLLMVGGEICKILLHLYDLSLLNDKTVTNKKKCLIISALTSVLCVSQEAKNYAFHYGFLDIIVKQLKESYIQISLESIDCLRRVSDKKRVCPILKETSDLIGLVNNLMIGDERIKCEFTTLGLSDLIHKFWIWFCLQKQYLANVLKMLCNYTKQCPIGI